jgi:hypothetical protein
MGTWYRSWNADPAALRLADRHYSRQHIGSNQMMPPGRQLVLVTGDESAVWGTAWPFARYVKRDRRGAADRLIRDRLVEAAD